MTANADERYRDLDLSFLNHPITGDILKITGEDAVVQSIKNLILTEFYERMFHPEIGSQIHGLLFENMTPITAGLIADSIRDVITNYEPRAGILDLEVEADEENNGYTIFLKIKILSTIDPIDVAFFLSRTR